MSKITIILEQKALGCVDCAHGCVVRIASEFGGNPAALPVVLKSIVATLVAGCGWAFLYIRRMVFHKTTDPTLSHTLPPPIVASLPTHDSHVVPTSVSNNISKSDTPPRKRVKSTLFGKRNPNEYHMIRCSRCTPEAPIAGDFMTKFDRGICTNRVVTSESAPAGRILGLPRSSRHS